MCGIIGYVGHRTSEVLQRGIKRLTYRGYDSWGFGFKNGNEIEVIKDIGDVENIGKLNINGNSKIGICHTRWATHGGVTKENAHPHTCCENKIAVVHNGIIENYRELKKELIERGHEFRSDTDTEVISHLIEESYKINENFPEAVKDVVPKLRGCYAFVAVHKDFDGLVGIKNGSPLVVGIGNSNHGQSEYFIASDVIAFLEYTKKVIYLDDGEMAVVKCRCQ